MTEDVTIFVAKRCEVEREVFRQSAVVFEKFANLVGFRSEVVHFGTLKKSFSFVITNVSTCQHSASDPTASGHHRRCLRTICTDCESSMG